MKKEYRHKDKMKEMDRLIDLLSSHSRIPWKKGKTEVWNELEKNLAKEDPSAVKVRHLHPGRKWIAMASSLALLLSVSAFMRFYTVKTFCPQGVHASVTLPDGSNVELNASTHLDYHPYWWFISREVKLEGEAFFHVEKGKEFRVVSTRAITEVLGTTFNVFARDADYMVTCHTGRVLVSETRSGRSVILSPNEKSVLEPSGGFTVTQLTGMPDAPGWTENLIMFVSTPLRLVFDEIERQFGIVIETPDAMMQVYSGNFSLNQPLENILSLICLPFDLEYEYQTGNKYLVYPSTE